MLLQSQAGHFHLLHETIRRTHTANVPRYVLIPDPIYIEELRLFYKAAIRWIDHTFRGTGCWIAAHQSPLNSPLANEEHDICSVPDQSCTARSMFSG